MVITSILNPIFFTTFSYSNKRKQVHSSCYICKSTMLWRFQLSETRERPRSIAGALLMTLVGLSYASAANADEPMPLTNPLQQDIVLDIDPSAAMLSRHSNKKNSSKTKANRILQARSKHQQRANVNLIH